MPRAEAGGARRGSRERALALLLLMMMRIACVPALAAAEHAEAGARDAALEAAFVAAARDPAQVVPLIERASRAIIAADARDGLALAKRLAPWSWRLYLSDERLPGMEALGVGVVRMPRGLTRWGLARRWRIGTEALAWLNPPDARAEFKVVDGRTRPFTFVVARGSCAAVLWHGPTMIAVLPVAVGADGHATPLGETTIAVRVADPEWKDPVTGRLFAPHDPGNLLGGYWLGFAPGPARRFRSIGIHGWTGDPPADWLAQPSSHGCIRMAPDGLALVFGFLQPGSRVVVRP